MLSTMAGVSASWPVINCVIWAAKLLAVPYGISCMFQTELGDVVQGGLQLDL